MATYASTTNPFLECAASDRSQVTKNAPGMAISQRAIDETKAAKKLDPSLGSDNNQSKSSSAKKDENGNIIDLIDTNYIDDKSDDEKIVVSEQDDKDLLNEDLDSEIAKACQSLVEGAIKLTLDGDIGQSENKSSVESVQSHSQGKAIKNTRILEDSDDGDEEEEDSSIAMNGDERGPMEQDNRRNQHIELIKKLRLQLRDLERYAYERGELDHVPPSVLAERQSVIIDTLKEKLSLNIGKEEIEKLELDELKRQVDKEISEVVDPIVTREHLLSQLRTQLTDLEQYITHLHVKIGKRQSSDDCSCQLHGCSSSSSQFDIDGQNLLIGADTLPKTTKLIRTIVAQLICSDIKIQEAAKKEQTNTGFSNQDECHGGDRRVKQDKPRSRTPQFHDNAAWTIHIDKVILATDSLMNLFTLEPEYKRVNEKITDEALVESIVRRQLVPALKELLSYGLIDPSSFMRSTSYTSFLFDPYYLLSSLTCFPSSANPTSECETLDDRIHIWHIIEDYYKSRSGPNFKQSSVKTLSQSFNITPSLNGPIKITSKQALLIAVDDIIEKMSRCKPNGPESHFKIFVYTALNQCKLSTWLRVIFKSKSVMKKYYHNFSFVSQPEKMDKFLATVDVLNQIEFKLRVDMESIDQFVSAF